MREAGIFRRLRDFLAEQIVAAAIGIDTVIVARQKRATDTAHAGDIYQEIAVAIEEAENNVVVLISTPEAKVRDMYSSPMDCDATFAVTLFSTPVCAPERVADEDIFHDLLLALHQRAGPAQSTAAHPFAGFKIEGWGEFDDLPESVDLLARQIILTRNLVIKPRAELPAP